MRVSIPAFLDVWFYAPKAAWFPVDQAKEHPPHQHTTPSIQRFFRLRRKTHITATQSSSLEDTCTDYLTQLLNFSMTSLNIPGRCKL